jgi:phosphate transport system permease protein
MSTGATIQTPAVPPPARHAAPDLTVPPPELPAPPADRPVPPPDRPRTLRARTLDDKLSLRGAAVGSLSLVWLLYGHILPLHGALGFIICWYVAFLGLYAAVSSVGNPRPIIADRLAAAVVHGGAVTVGIALVSVIFFTFYRGWKPLLHLNFYSSDMAGVLPFDPLTRGGVLHAITGTIVELAIAIAVSLPLGVGAAVFMTEVGGRFARAVRTVVEAMTALPSIVAGLFIYTTLIVALHVPRSGLTAAMAISVMMLPIIARAADVVLRVVPGGLREAGLALGSTHWRTVWHVVLPTARPGLATALILGVARGVGETSPVLLTSGASTFFNADPLHSWMNSLPLFVFTAVRSGQPIYIERGFAAASVLLALVLLLFVVARRVARQRRGR